MRLIVFGATGGTGKHFVQQALDAGHIVTVVVRNPGSFNISHHNLDIVKADVLQLESFESAMKEQDAVVSSLGTRNTKNVVVYSKGINNIIAAMQRYNVQRVLTITAVPVENNPRLSFLYKILTKLLQFFLKDLYADMLRMEQQIKAINFCWTIVRPPKLTNGMLKNKYRFAINEWLAKCTSISRADLAHFMLAHISDTSTYKSIIEISY